MDTRKILDNSKFAQIGFVVHDIEAAKAAYALLFDCAAPETRPGGDYAMTRTRVYGEPAPEAAADLAFFQLSDGVQLELIQPNDKPSVWRDHLDKYGEGVHHIAFQVEDADEAVRRLQEKFGAVVEQEGNYGDGSGKYVYLDVQEQLKCRIELLQSFAK